MSTGDIAIIGLDITLPQCSNRDDVWEFLNEKRISKGKFPAQRLEQIGLLADDGCFMDGSYFNQIDQFDHRFFNISQKSADYMDPNQRLTLLSATRAIQDSGYLHNIKGTNTGVYASVNTTQQYQYLQLLQEWQLKPDLLGMLNSTISSRINYIYDLSGPSIMTDTACSSSLVSVIQACNDLRGREVDSAVIVSSNIYVKPGYKDEKLVDILAVDAKTKTFDERSTGTSMGEGVCSIILKRREDAERDGDHIYGFIKSYALNNDGHTMNMASPNPLAQENLIEQAWAPLGDEINRVAFIEAHGTGTAIGDTIEFDSLNQYFSSFDICKQSVALTACKSNFGHLDVASGLFSLIKSVLSLQKRTIIPHPDFKIPNMEIDFQDSIFYIPDKGQSIKDHALAGISSFGMTGTNAHVVIQRAEQENTHSASELQMKLNSYWFPLEMNSFGKTNQRQHIENEATILSKFHLNICENWEIREHKFNKKHLLVGTSFFEILSQALGDSRYSLEQYNVRNLHILNQLILQKGSCSIVFALDKPSLKGTISFSIEDEVKPWIHFELIPKESGSIDHAVFQTEAGLQEIIVTNQVGESDEEDIAVSKRWDVVDQLWINAEKTKAVVKLKAPPGYEKEFALYHFYPSILDPALNALNRIVEPSDIVFPWYWSEISFNQSRLQGTEFYSEICLREKTNDDIGNIILSLDIRLFDTDQKLILSIQNYKVKNALKLQKEETTTFFKQQSFIPIRLELLNRRYSQLCIVHESMRDQYSFEAPVVFFSDLTDLATLAMNLAGIEQIYFWDQSYTDERRIAQDMYTLGQFLLQLNKESKLKQFHYINTQLFGYDAMNVFNRSMAMGVYSLRLEVSYKVKVIDIDRGRKSAEIMEYDFQDEDFIVQQEDQFNIVRYTNFKLEPSIESKFKDHHVLIIGGSSGIGLEYVRYLREKYPALNITVAGRKSEFSCPALRDQVSYVALDISNAYQLQEFAKTQGQAFAYILNFAGEPAQGLFVTKSSDMFCSKTTSKINGSTMLQSYFPDAQEIIHFSSLAGQIGAIGQTEYCIGNAYQSGLPYISPRVRTISLTGWEDVGMSAGKADPLFEKVHSSIGVELLHQFVQSNVKEAVMYKAKPAAEGYTSILSKVMKVKSMNTAFHHDPGKQQTTESKILSAWQQVLGEDDYDITSSFFEQGGDSITIVHLCDELNRSFTGLFDVTTLFSIPTIQGQCDFVESSLKQEKQKNVKEISFDAQELLDFLKK